MTPTVKSRVPGAGGLFALGVLGLLLAHARLLFFAPGKGAAEGLERTLFEPTAASPWIVVPCWFWLCWNRWPRLRALAGAGVERPVEGVVLFLGGWMLSAWAHLVTWPPLLVPGLALLSLGTALLFCGPAGLRTMLLPAGFLLLAMPLPTPLINAIAYPAQVANASIVADLLGAFGISAVASGERVLMGEVIAQVIEGCTGIRSLITTVMAACLYVELTWHDRRRSRALILLSIPIAMLSNFLRILSILFNPYGQIATVHTVQGMLAITASLVFLFLADLLLARFWKTEPEPFLEVPDGAGKIGRPVLVAFATLSLGLLALAQFGPDWTRRTRAPLPAITSIRAEDPSWVIRGFAPDVSFLGSARFDDALAHRLSRAKGREVHVFVATDHRLDPSIGLGSPKTRLLGSGSRWLGSRDGIVAPEPWIEAGLVRAEGKTHLVYAWTVGIETFSEELFRAFLALDRSPWSRPGRAVSVRLSTPTDDGHAAANARLDALLASLRSDLQRVEAWGGAGG